MMRTVADEGYGRTSVEAVLRRAGVSRLTFYQQFADKEDCFLQAYDTAVAQLMAIVLEAYRQPKQWAERVRFGLEALLETLSNEPDLARMAMVEVLAAGPRAIARYTNAVNSFMPLFEAGRTETRYGTQLPSQTERVIVGGIASVITHRVAAGEAERLCELLPDLLYFALTPFLGIARAARGANKARAARAEEEPGKDEAKSNPAEQERRTQAPHVKAAIGTPRHDDAAFKALAPTPRS